MANKLLIVIPGVIPTVEIIVRTLKQMGSHYQLNVVLASKIKIQDILSDEYLILFIRICDPSLKPILNLMKQYKIKYYYYLDDNFWEIGKGKGALAECYSNPQLIKTLNGFIRNAHVVITGSEPLKKYIMSKNQNIISMKAAFDFELIDNLQKEPKSEKIKILYSGSLYREQDFSVVIPALKRILHEYREQVVIYFNGFVPGELKTYTNVVYDENFYPYDCFIKKQYQMNYDIGIAPLHNGLSSQAKSNLKYREYGACSIAGIYSNIPPYSDCITHLENGFLVEHNEDAWYHALKELIANQVLRDKMVLNAFNDVHANYNHERIAEDWRKQFHNISKRRVKKSVTLMRCFSIKLEQKLLAVRYKIKRAGDYYKSYGLNYTCRKIVRNIWSRQ